MRAFLMSIYEMAWIAVESEWIPSTMKTDDGLKIIKSLLQ